MRAKSQMILINVKRQKREQPRIPKEWGGVQPRQYWIKKSFSDVPLDKDQR